MNQYTRGSEWRIWDLHVHTPASYNCKGDFNTLIKNFRSSEAQVIGINDYCTISGYEEIIKLGGVKDKILFPVIEFRMHNILGNRKGLPTQNGVKINFHIIFNNTDAVIARVKTWLTALKCFNEKGNTDQLGNIAKDKYEFLSFDFNDLVESLKQLNLKNDALIWLPYDEYGGVGDINPKDNFFKLGLLNKIDIIGSSSVKQRSFFLWKDAKYSLEQYQEWFNKPIPCIKGSDAHDVNYPFGKLKDENSNPTDRYCWIKADPTFEGLKQIINEPEERVFIGKVPPKLEDLGSNRARYINSIKVNHINPSTGNPWFNSQLLLSVGLVAIIGKKGSGKSALADIVSLLGKSKVNPGDYSFLVEGKFKKRGLAKNYTGALEWMDGVSVVSSLNDDVGITEVEKVKYLPQKHVEKICNEDDGVSKLFQEEIDKVIFSYVPRQNKNVATNLNELIEIKTKVIDDAIFELRESLHKINSEICSLEDKTRSEYRNKIEARLKEKERELANLLVPDVVKKPKTTNTPTQNKAEALVVQIKDLDKKIEEDIDILTKTNTSLTKLESVSASLNQLKEKVKLFLDRLSDDANFLSINLSDIVELNIKTDSLDSKKRKLLELKKDLEKRLNKKDPQSKDSLYIKRDKLEKELEGLEKTLNPDQKTYQNYLVNLKKYNDAKDLIIGKKGYINLETITSLKEEIEYLDKKIIRDLSDLVTQRDLLVKNIFGELYKKISFYKEIYQPLIDFVKEEKDIQEKSGSVLTFDVSPVLNKSLFSQTFLSFINQQKNGSFQGKDSGFKVIKTILDGFATFNEKGLFAFLNDLSNHLKKDVTQDSQPEIDINSQLNNASTKKVEFYNFIYDLEYLSIKYKILFNGKDLNDDEFSPGEKGALLLIFYLLIDKDTNPLIMDQPEENLDNESVFTLLVPYIKKAKRRRQIIIVTHNPNLAIACDAEQIISASMNKKTSAITYVAGSIESPTLNRKVVDVLEGTMPAFNIRDRKYIKNTG